MRGFSIVLIVLLAVPAVGEAQTTDPNLAVIPRDDPAMARAVATAQATLPSFLALSRHPKPGMVRFAVKVGLGPAGAQEFVWLRPFVEEDGKVTGALANEPERVMDYHMGQVITVPLGAVADWSYFEDGRMRGNVTACVLVAKDGPGAVAAFERAYGADCGAL